MEENTYIRPVTVQLLGSIAPDHLYEIVPGFLLASVAAVTVTLLTSHPDPAIARRFDHMLLLMAGRDPNLPAPNAEQS